MGIGGGPGEDDDLEWVRLADLPPDPRVLAEHALAEAMRRWGESHLRWQGRNGDEDGAGTPDRERFLLVDLDNIRADPARLRARLALLGVVAAGADHVVLAGQDGAVRRARPWLGGMAETTYVVPKGADLADHVLLDEARDLSDGGPAQFVVASNDGIFARLAARGPLTLLSPGAASLNDRLRAAADRVVDLDELEALLGGRPVRVAAPRAAAGRPHASGGVQRRRRAGSRGRPR